jgi:hypothetical protein
MTRIARSVREAETPPGAREIANCGPVPKAVYLTSALGGRGAHRIDALLSWIPSLPPRLAEPIAAARSLPPGTPLPPALVADVATFLREAIVAVGDAAEHVPPARMPRSREDDGEPVAASEEQRATRALVALREAIGLPRLLARNVILASRDLVPACEVPGEAVLPAVLRGGGDDDAIRRGRLRHIANVLVLSATCTPPLVVWHRTPSPAHVRAGEWIHVTILGDGGAA